ncbi:tRNA (adenosine(37)-N6)-threonylcarbamoyltransferase complex ATPase subunit type 1 TsaE [Roseivivax sp. THAF30]|uniref:tRNA (adenosine(37)-N6)-threonylcarbamoyltransferase complex ATPase subunit type 1 TsaE n=1 Tax=Roseivivax sp. THAF30 TaxID=2587852 RepID=UPI0012697EC5|nr:tRNA (adenosine(37)-N6)-threonylcarbamoyltransferase complex ATPase subunit type 1 TsaE [Roseivivax sp. THAF30]QFT64863.1 tRNA threonylcarbamoyladenosine biosynthesis protein TsaE [Roseivivax sp. THAF30]
MCPERRHLILQSPDETASLAQRIAPVLRPGDTILLSGGIGAGKTHFARSLIQKRLAVPEDVPSPTFTLVQTYETGTGEIWHADLYRLDGPQSIDELGLAEAFDTAICLVEWPDRLGDLAPEQALFVAFESGPVDEARSLEFTWTDPRWTSRIEGVLS